MPFGWKAFDATALQGIVDTVNAMVASSNVLTQDRVLSRQCRATKTIATAAVKYRVPEAAMQEFPTTGTGEDDLLIAVMETDNKDSCWTQKYGIQSELGGHPRLVQFVTVRTISAAALPGVDQRVGQWRSWTIYRDPQKGLTLLETDNGAFIACGHRHFGDPDQSRVQHAFIDCRTVAEIAKSAQSAQGSSATLQSSAAVLPSAAAPAAAPAAAAVAARFADLMLEYRIGKNPLRLTYDPTTESAWGRCGNLGCCAAE